MNCLLLAIFLFRRYICYCEQQWLSLIYTMSGFCSKYLCPSSQIRCHDRQNYRTRLAPLLPQESLLCPQSPCCINPRPTSLGLLYPATFFLHVPLCMPSMLVNLSFLPQPFTHHYISPGWLPTLFPASSKLPKPYWFFETVEPRVLGLSGYPLTYRQWRDCSGKDSGRFTQTKTKQLSTSNS